MCRAAVAAGADGLIIEVHNDPEHALTDGAQSVTHQQFAEMMKAIRRIAAAVDREV
jgi:3-deoxy-7-phosphoheptulonate synthase